MELATRPGPRTASAWPAGRSPAPRSSLVAECPARSGMPRAGRRGLRPLRPRGGRRCQQASVGATPPSSGDLRDIALVPFLDDTDTDTGARVAGTPPSSQCQDRLPRTRRAARPSQPAEAQGPSVTCLTTATRPTDVGHATALRLGAASRRGWRWFAVGSARALGQTGRRNQRQQSGVSR